MTSDLQGKGFKILLAHPERIGAFHRDVRLLERLVSEGCVTSVTASSLAGQFGSSVKRFTQDLFARGLVHNLASDAHDAHFRSPALQPTLDKALADMPELEDWLDYLTVQTPRAVIAGETPPGQPPVIEVKRGGIFGRLRRR
jgi:protein-tyrosine phosphatase